MRQEEALEPPAPLLAGSSLDRGHPGCYHQTKYPYHPYAVYGKEEFFVKTILFPGLSRSVAPVCFGTVHFGDRVQAEEAFALLDAYVRAGGNFIDTANCYGRWLPPGENVSEQMLGEWLRRRGCRKELLLSTKGGHPSFGDMGHSRLSQKELELDLESSLRALGTDCVDVYWLHRDEPALPAEELVERLEGFRKQGKLLAYGVSNWSATRLEEAARYAARQGYSGFCGVQNQWSLAAVNPEQIGDRTLVCMDQEQHRLLEEGQGRLGILAFSAMGKGFFSREYAGTLAPDALPEYRNQCNCRRLQALRQLAGEKGVSIAALVLAWMAAKPFPAVPIATVSSQAHLDELTQAFQISLDQEEVALLDAGRSY